MLGFSSWTSLGQSLKADSHVRSEIGFLGPRRGGSDSDLSMIDADMACQGLAKAQADVMAVGTSETRPEGSRRQRCHLNRMKNEAP